MGSHYIPVGKIKIDKEILDIACPAAGYGETPPDPAIYCPANGYNEDDSWQEPFVFPDPESEQILLLCDDMEQGVISFDFRVNVGSKKIELLNSDMSVILTDLFTSYTYQLEFPTKNTGKYYIIRLSPDTPTSTIISFYRASYTGYDMNYRVLQAKFYTPNITTLASCFYGFTAIREVLFFTNMNSLTTMANSFYGSSIERIQWPQEMNALTTFSATFQTTFNYKQCDLSGTSLNALSLLTNMFRDSNIEVLKFPAALPEATNLMSLCYNCYLIKTVILPLSAPKITSISGLFYNNYKLISELNYPEMPLMTNMSSAHYRCYLIPKITFAGNMNACTNISSLARDCKSLREITFPANLNGAIGSSGHQYVLLGCTALKTVNMPLSMTGVAGNTSQWCSNITEDFTECLTWPASGMGLWLSTHKLKNVYQPNLRASLLIIGYSSAMPAQCTSVEIDWANSAFDAPASGINITIRAQLPDTEINRIFTALPTLAGVIDVKYNPGYATCDPSIAQAKGWTVL